MAAITLQTANNLFKEQKYREAFDQYSFLIEHCVNPAFSSFMAGKCLEHRGSIPEAYTYFKKAVAFDDSNTLINREVEQFLIANNRIEKGKKILLHYFPTTTNIGDSGAAAGIRMLLTAQTRELFFYTLSCRKDTISQIRELPFDAAGILIGGGGLFFRQPLASGWYFPLTGSELEELSLPTVTYAVGFNQQYSDEDAWRLDRSFTRHIAGFHRHFRMRSVRDEWSKNILENEGVTDIDLVPCPSAFLKPLPWYTPDGINAGNIIGISITDRSMQDPVRRNIFSTILAFARWLVQHDFHPLFILHDAGDDLSLAELITENHFSCVVPHTAREAVTLYDRCTCVVGMRGHSLILAAGRSVPFLGISYNKKIDAFMEMLQLQEYCLNQDAITESIILINAFEKLLRQKDALVTHLRNKRDIFYMINKTFCEKATSLFLMHKVMRNR